MFIISNENKFWLRFKKKNISRALKKLNGRFLNSNTGLVNF